MNTLRNLKILKSNNIPTKSLSNKVSRSLYQNNNNLNLAINDLKNSNLIFTNVNSNYNYKNNINFKINNLNNQLDKFNFLSKKNFSTFANETTLENLPNNNNSELNANQASEAINFNYLYTPETTSDDNNLNGILSKFEDSKTLNGLKKRKTKNYIKERELDKNLAEKNMLYVAYMDINKRFPLRGQYDIEIHENNIKSKLYKNLNVRDKAEAFTSKLGLEDLIIKSKAFTFAYKKDDLYNFVNNISAFIHTAEKECKIKYSEFYFVKYTEELNSLIKYFSSLINKEENNYYSDNLYLINNKVLIRLINEIEILIIESLGNASGFSAEFAQGNEEVILNSLHKYKISDFSQEKNLHFKSRNFSSLLKTNSESIFKADFLTKNLIPYLTNTITILTKQYGEQSVELSKYYYMLSFINLKLKNFEKSEEYIEKSFAIYSKNKKTLLGENSKEYFLNEISHLEYLFIKSQIIGIFQSNKKDTLLILKQASELAEEIESKYYSLISYKNKNNMLEQFCLDKEYNFSALKFKINYNLSLFFKQYNFILEEQAALEKCLKINSFALKSNKNLMNLYHIASKLLIEINENLNLKRNIYNISKKNFNLSYYIINDKNEKFQLMKFYADKIIENINFSFDKFNLPNMLNTKKPSFSLYKKSQENFILSLISFYQNEHYNYSIGAILNDYLENINNTDMLYTETFENSCNIINTYYNNINNNPANYSEAVKNLIKLREQLELNEFLDDVLANTNYNNNETENQEKNNNENKKEIEVDEFKKELEDKFYFYRKNKEIQKQWINLAISVNYNIIINQIKSKDYEEALGNIDYLLKFINKLNENKSVGSVIEHPYLLVNLNLIAAHYHLIKNQKIYSVKYLKEVNAMITKYDWGSKNEINAYLTEMVKLINTI